MLRSDGWGEYFFDEFSEYLQNQQFKLNIHLDIPLNYYWTEAIAIVVNIMNKTTITVVHGVTPEEKFTRRQPDLSHLKVFGCIAYVHILDENRTKLDPKAKSCVFIGCSSQQKGHKHYSSKTRQMSVSIDVVFDEMSS